MDMAKCESEARRERAKLLARIQSKVPVEETITSIAEKTISWIKVTDPDRLLLTALEKGEQGGFEVDPFWAAAWRAAVGMDRFLGELSSSLGSDGWTDLPVLELGGGSGRAGISAAMRGARVVITDASSTAMLVCRYNAWHVRNKVLVRRLDWRDRNQHLGYFPILVGSDIVYDPKLFPILEPCMRRHLTQGGAVYLSEPQRHTGERFRSWIQSAGWLIREHYVDLEDGEKKIRIFECRLPR
ncbi:MAG: protein N-lysine methyltransferase family protein [Pirellula sp.]|nr:protein N-lysine methyltransferase family protein [Pirellula sp.]